MTTGRPKGKYTQAYRLVKIMEMLQTKQQVTIGMLVNEFGVSRRTANRDLATLQETYSIEEVGQLDDKQKIWRLSSRGGSEFIKLSVMEMAALFMGKNLFNFTRGTALKDSIDSLYSKVSHRLTSQRSAYSENLEFKFYCTPGAPKDYAQRDDQLNEIVTGLLEEQKVRVLYRPPNRKSYEVVLHPWTLVAHHNGLYLIAFSERSQTIRTFAVERILDANWLRGESFPFPENYDPQKYLSQAFGITVGSPAEVVLRAGQDTVEYFQQRQWHHSQRLEESADGVTYIHLQVPLTPELISWILSFGSKVEVLRPEKLRHQIRHIIDAMARLYSDDESPAGEEQDSTTHSNKIGTT